MKAVCLAVLKFLPHLDIRNLLFHEHNQAVCYVLAGLASRSPGMMEELRRLSFTTTTFTSCPGTSNSQRTLMQTSSTAAWTTTSGS
jgi:hypothetical protein